MSSLWKAFKFARMIQDARKRGLALALIFWPDDHIQLQRVRIAGSKYVVFRHKSTHRPLIQEITKTYNLMGVKCYVIDPRAPKTVDDDAIRLAELDGFFDRIVDEVRETAARHGIAIQGSIKTLGELKNMIDLLKAHGCDVSRIEASLPKYNGRTLNLDALARWSNIDTLGMTNMFLYGAAGVMRQTSGLQRALTGASWLKAALIIILIIVFAFLAIQFLPGLLQAFTPQRVGL